MIQNFPTPPLPDELRSPPEILEIDVARNIHSFLCGSAGGPDGILPQHLFDLTIASAEQGGKDLLQTLTKCVNFARGEHVPQFVVPVFFGAILIPLWKKEGGICPIAVGQTLHHLLAKCVAVQVSHTVGSGLIPNHLGFGVPFGCEPIQPVAFPKFGSMPFDVKVCVCALIHCFSKHVIIQYISFDK